MLIFTRIVRIADANGVMAKCWRYRYVALAQADYVPRRAPEMRQEAPEFRKYCVRAVQATTLDKAS